MIVLFCYYSFNQKAKLVKLESKLNLQSIASSP